MVVVEQNARSPKRPKAPRVTLTVTKEVIDSAEQRSSSHCMWADALKMALPTAQKVAVDLQTIRFTDPEKGLRYTYLTPRLAQVTLVRFDQGIHTEPCSIELRGGQVTKARGYVNGKQQHRRREAMPDGHKVELQMGDAKSNGNAATVVGGSPPPIGALPSPSYGHRRRTFGLRALDL